MKKVWLVTVFFLGLVLRQAAPVTQAAETSQFFPETGFTVSGKFLEYWQANGGLPVFGYPITAAQPEVDPETGKTFLTQWFERNRFELHPENAGTKYEVLLGLLGKDLRREALAVDPDFAPTLTNLDPAFPVEQQTYFPETGHNLRYGFLNYWKNNGGLERFGYPISEEFRQVDPETGKVFVMQWFERARFEYHPENKPPYDILLGLLGNQLKKPTSAEAFVWNLGATLKSQALPYHLAFDPLDPRGYLYAADRYSKQLIKYSTSGTIVNNWELASYPLGLIVGPDSNLYVATRLDAEKPVFIQKYRADGKLLLEWETSKISGSVGASSRAQLASDSSGNIYMAHRQEQALLKFSPDGKLLLKFDIRLTNQPTSDAENVALDKAGNIYVSDNTTGVIKKFSPAGQFLAKSDAISVNQQSVEAQALVVDSTNNVYVSLTNGFNSQVQKFDSQLKKVADIGKAGPQTEDDRYNIPYGLAMDTRSNLYVADLSNVGSIMRFDAAGKYLGRLSGTKHPTGKFNLPAAIALAKNGDFYVIDQFNNRIQKFDRTGKFISGWGKYGMGNSEFIYPKAVALDSAGNVYVGEGSRRLQKFTADGKFLSLLTLAGDSEQLGNIGDISIDASGNIFVADVSYMKIRKFDPDGKLLKSWKLPDSDKNGAQSFNFQIESDSAGNIYTLGLNLHKFDNNGQLVKKFEIEQLSPTVSPFMPSLALDNSGNIYIGMTTSGDTVGAIFKYSPVGTLLSGFTPSGDSPNANGAFAAPTSFVITDDNALLVVEGQKHRVIKFRTNKFI